MAKPKFNFKSSGTRKGVNRQFDNPVIIEQNIGIKTPMELGSDRENLYRSHTDPVKQIKDNLRNLIQTNYGERLGRSEIGADLIALVFDASKTGEFLRLADIKIRETVKKYMPFIAINSVDIEKEIPTNSQLNSFLNVSANDSLGLRKILLNINYNITRIGLNNQILQVFVFVGG